MNNEQNNNNIFGINDLISSSQANNQNPTSTESVIPGANLTPIGGTPIPETQPTTPLQTNLNSLIQPVQGDLASTPTNNVISTNANSVMPGTVNPIFNGNVVEPTTPQPNNNLNIVNSSPFDIGLNSTINTEKTQIIDPILSGSNNISNTTNENSQLLNNNSMQPLNNNVTNNFGDATPLTNANINNTSNDNIVSVGKYLGYILLFSIPIVGFIMLLVKAFGDKKDKNISNLAKAQLILIVIATVLSIVLSIAFGALIASAISGNSTQTNDYNYSSNYDYEYDYDFNY